MLNHKTPLATMPGIVLSQKLLSAKSAGKIHLFLETYTPEQVEEDLQQMLMHALSNPATNALTAEERGQMAYLVWHLCRVAGVVGKTFKIEHLPEQATE